MEFPDVKKKEKKEIPMCGASGFLLLLVGKDNKFVITVAPQKLICPKGKT